MLWAVWENEKFDPAVLEFSLKRFNAVVSSDEMGRAGRAVQLCPYETSEAACRHPWGAFIGLVDAFSFGALTWAMGFKMIGDNLVLATPAGKDAVNFYTLEKRSGGHAYHGRLLRAAAAQRRSLFVVFLLFLALYSSFLDLTFLGGTFTASAFRYISVVAIYLVQDASPVERTAFIAFFSNIFVAFAYIAVVLAGSPVTALLTLPKGALNAVLPILCTTPHPMCMISYAWEYGKLQESPSAVPDGKPAPPHHPEGKARTQMVRSLSHALPNCWIDVKYLSAGMHIGVETVAAAATSFCMVISADKYYFSRPNCVIELIAACRRDPGQQHTLLLVPPHELSPSTLEFFKFTGMTIFHNPAELLDHLSVHVYSCTSPLDSRMLQKWYREYGQARSSIDRTPLLPSPTVFPVVGAPSSFLRGVHSILRLLLSFFLPPPPRQALVAGTSYLAKDALSRGECSSYSFEHLALLLLFAGLCVCIAVATSFGFGYSAWIICVLVAAFLCSLFFPLAIYLDPRVYHSQELLPINAAALCNVFFTAKRGAATRHTHLVAVEEKLPFTVGFYVTGRGLSVSSRLFERLDNVCAFLKDVCGLEAKVFTMSFDHTLLDSLKATSKDAGHVAVFVMQSALDARNWTDSIRPFWPESQSVLVSTKFAFDAVFNAPKVLSPAGVPHTDLSHYINVVAGNPARRLHCSFHFASSVTDQDVRASSTEPAAFFYMARAPLTSLTLPTPWQIFACQLVDAIASKVAHSFFGDIPSCKTFYAPFNENAPVAELVARAISSLEASHAQQRAVVDKHYRLQVSALLAA